MKQAGLVPWPEALAFALGENELAVEAYHRGDIVGAEELLKSAEAATRAATLAFEAENPPK